MDTMEVGSLGRGDGSWFDRMCGDRSEVTECVKHLSRVARELLRRYARTGTHQTPPTRDTTDTIR